MNQTIIIIIKKSLKTILIDIFYQLELLFSFDLIMRKSYGILTTL